MMVNKSDNASCFAAPLGIVGTCVCSAITGTAYLLALLFAIPNVTSFIENSSGVNGTENLAVATYQLAVPFRGAFALTMLLILNMYFAGMSAITANSRIGYELGIRLCSSDRPPYGRFLLALPWLAMVFFHSRTISDGYSNRQKRQ